MTYLNHTVGETFITYSIRSGDITIDVSVPTHEYILEDADAVPIVTIYHRDKRIGWVKNAVLADKLCNFTREVNDLIKERQ